MILPFLLTLAQAKQADIPAGVIDRIDSISKELDALRGRVTSLHELVSPRPGAPIDRLDVFHGYVPVFVVAFLVTLVATPLIRRLALANGIIDRRSEARKMTTHTTEAQLAAYLRDKNTPTTKATA